MQNNIQSVNYRVTKPGGNMKITFTDHRTTNIVVKGINRSPPLEKYTTWSWKDADWVAYARSSRRAAARLERRVEEMVREGEEVEMEPQCEV